MQRDQQTFASTTVGNEDPDQSLIDLKDATRATHPASNGNKPVTLKPFERRIMRRLPAAPTLVSVIQYGKWHRGDDRRRRKCRCDRKPIFGLAYTEVPTAPVDPTGTVQRCGRRRTPGRFDMVDRPAAQAAATRRQADQLIRWQIRGEVTRRARRQRQVPPQPGRRRPRSASWSRRPGSPVMAGAETVGFLSTKGGRRGRLPRWTRTSVFYLDFNYYSRTQHISVF